MEKHGKTVIVDAEKNVNILFYQDVYYNKKRKR
jgi:hypothetical protein